MSGETDNPTPFSWDDFLQLAEALSSAQDEASLRSSVSRAYYAVFHAALEKAQTLGVLPSGTSHAKLWQFYRPDASGAKRWFRRVRDTGRALQDLREKADYDISSLDWIENSKTAVSQAKKLLQDLQTYR